MSSHDLADIMIFRFRFSCRAFTNRMPRCLARWKRRTNTSCCRNDGASKENLYFDDQKKEVVSPSFVAVFSKREIDSMLPCVTDDVKMSKKRKSGRWGDSRVCNWCFYHIYNWLLLWSITEQTHSNMESICCYNMESNCSRKKAFFISKFFNITRKSPFAQFGKQEESHLTWCIVFTKWAISLVVMRLQKSRHCHLNWAVAYREMNWKLTAKAELNCEIYQC